MSEQRRFTNKFSTCYFLFYWRMRGQQKSWLVLICTALPCFVFVCKGWCLCVQIGVCVFRLVFVCAGLCLFVQVGVVCVGWCLFVQVGVCLCRCGFVCEGWFLIVYVGVCAGWCSLVQIGFCLCWRVFVCDISSLCQFTMVGVCL